MAHHSLSVLIVAFIVSLLPAAHAQDRFVKFKQHDPKSDTRLTYDELSLVLRTIVFDVGRSDRKPATRPADYTGSRLSRQYKGRYRLEGNRISFSLQNDALEMRFTLLRQGLEDAATEVGLQNLNRREQLAFWFNLHNVALIEQLAKVYPITSTRNLDLASGEEFFATPVVTIEGEPLSLDDIRKNIVFRSYAEPEVIYGFFLGSIGGPNIRREAFTGASLDRQLRENAVEFVNSLRGVENNERRIRVSRIYDDARELFPNWPNDLVAHLRAYGENDVDDIVSRRGRVHADVFPYTIADLSYGDASPPPGNLLSTRRTGTGGFQTVGGRLSPQTMEFVQKVQERRLRRYRERGGTVEIIDIETDDEGRALISLDDPEEQDNDAPADQ